LQKGCGLCQEETVQDLGAKDPVEVEDEDKVEAEWTDHLQRGRAEIVYVQAAEQQLLMLQDSLVIQKAVLNVVQK